MGRLHGWRECFPVYVAIGTPPAGRRERMTEAAQRVWGYLPDTDKAAFHRFTCLRRIDRQHIEAATNINRQIRAEAGLVGPLDLVREFRIEAAVNDDPRLLRDIFDLQLGIPLRPQGRAELAASGDTRHVLYVVRVRDLLAIEDPNDPRTASIRRRRQVAPCADCAEDCFYDPRSQVAPECATMLCTACARWRLVLERRGAGR